MASSLGDNYQGGQCDIWSTLRRAPGVIWNVGTQALFGHAPELDQATANAVGKGSRDLQLELEVAFFKAQQAALNIKLAAPIADMVSELNQLHGESIDLLKENLSLIPVVDKFSLVRRFNRIWQVIHLRFNTLSEYAFLRAPQHQRLKIGSGYFMLGPLPTKASFLQKLQEKVAVRSQLEARLPISRETLEAVETIAPQIKGRGFELEQKIQMYVSSLENKVFSLSSAPQLVFKISKSREAARARFNNMLKAQIICQKHDLNKLIVPAAKIVDLSSKITLIVEKRFEFDLDLNNQVARFQNLKDKRVVEQLARLIVEAKMTDMEWRNIPILRDPVSKEERIALVDLENMGSRRSDASLGLFGGFFMGVYPRNGLIECLFDPEQMDIVLCIAAENGIIPDRNRDPQQVKKKRLEDIQSSQNLQDFYRKKGILQNPAKSIKIDELHLLGLDLEEKATINLYNNSWLCIGQETVVLKDVIRAVISEINQKIKEGAWRKNLQTKDRRGLYIDPLDNFGKLKAYGRLGTGLERGGRPTRSQLKNSWIGRILYALKDKSHLFRVENDSDRFTIQA